MAAFILTFLAGIIVGIFLTVAGIVKKVIIIKGLCDK